MPFDMIAFDADDTLWHNERHYVRAQEAFKRLLAQYHSPEWIHDRLYATEMRNLAHFGYGVKAFALSMIETAIELTEGRVTAAEIQQVIDLAKTMLAPEVELFEHVADTLATLAATRRLMVITKGDLRDQEVKVRSSGLAPLFTHVEIVSEKRPEDYQRILDRLGLSPERFLMVGNSLRSDILPVLALGAHAVYIPAELVWLHEVVDPPPADQPGFHRLAHLGELPALLAQLEDA